MFSFYIFHYILILEHAGWSTTFFIEYRQATCANPFQFFSLENSAGFQVGLGSVAFGWPS